MPQAEQLYFVPPSKEYLDLLDENARRAELVPIESDILFVTRAGMIDRGKGSHAGERHLVECLGALGVRVLDPLSADLRTQLASYAGARKLLFSEGSSMHGRQLLGHVDQEIHVLVRRIGSRFCEPALQNRVSRLSYWDVTADQVVPTTDRHGDREDLAISFYDTEKVFAAFDAVGVDVRPEWNESAYQAQVAGDIEIWLRKFGGKVKGTSRTTATKVFGRFGVDF